MIKHIPYRTAKIRSREDLVTEKEMIFSIQDRMENVFLDNHIHFLYGDIVEENVQRAIEWIIYENSMECSKETVLQLHVNSIGGDLYQALGLIDVMRLSKIPIRTIGLGAVMSAGFLIFASGTPGQRYITKNCGIMCHQYSDTYEGKHHDLKSFTKEAELTNRRMLQILQDASGMTAKAVKTKLLSPSDVWLTAEELVSLGVADQIL
jgi:ATP-dependent Clp protease protease subunit